MITNDVMDIQELSETQLNVITGGEKIIGLCAGDYCANVGTDGLSFSGPETGPSAGAQVYAAVMRGMRNVTG